MAARPLAASARGGGPRHEEGAEDDRGDEVDPAHPGRGEQEQADRHERDRGGRSGARSRPADDRQHRHVGRRVVAAIGASAQKCGGVQ